MRALCCSCDDYMEYESHEDIAEGSVGIVFGCVECGHRIQLVMNPGETMLVHAMGVRIGSTGESCEPLELTRSTLAGEGAEDETPTSIEWSPAARERVGRIPQFVRAFAVRSIEDYALQNDRSEITEQVLDEYKATQGHV